MLVRVVMVLLALGLAGCTDPIVGEWESEDENACGERSSFEVDDDLLVEGSIWIEDDENQVCLKCDFEGEVEDLGGDLYGAEVEFDVCTCGNTREAEGECQLDGDTMECTLRFAACGSMTGEFERQK